MARAGSIKSIPAIKQLIIPVKGGKTLPKLDQLVAILARRFDRLGCHGCLSGINRIVIEDVVARGIR